MTTPLSSTLTPAGAAALELAKVAARAADDKKAEHTIVLAVGDVLAITESPMAITRLPSTRAPT